MTLYFDFFIEFLYLRGTESRTDTTIEPPVNKPPFDYMLTEKRRLRGGYPDRHRPDAHEFR
jgi:hypothetical protein